MREAKAKRTHEAVASAYASKRETSALALGRTQTIQLQLKIQNKVNNDRFNQLMQLFQVKPPPPPLCCIHILLPYLHIYSTQTHTYTHNR